MKLNKIIKSIFFVMILSTFSFSQEIHFYDMEGGNLDQWDATSVGAGASAAANTTSKMGGTNYGLQVQTATNSAVKAYAYKDVSDITTGTYFRFRVYFHPNASAGLASQEIFQAFQTTVAGLWTAIVADALAGVLQIRLRMRDDNSANQFTSYYTITNAEHYIEYYYKKSTNATSNDAEMRLFIDGAHKETKSGLDWFTGYGIGLIQCGITSNQDSLNLYLDEVVIRNDSTIIGPRQADRYWIASAPGNWNATANWAGVSGGIGGRQLPVAGDTVIFDANGLGTCNVNANVTAWTINLGSAYTDSFKCAASNPNITLGDGFTADNEYVAMGNGLWTLTGNLDIKDVTVWVSNNSKMIMTGTPRTITSSGKNLCSLYYNIAAGKLTFVDSSRIAWALVCTTSTCTIALTQNTGHNWDSLKFDGQNATGMKLISTSTTAARLTTLGCVGTYAKWVNLYYITNTPANIFKCLACDDITTYQSTGMRWFEQPYVDGLPRSMFRPDGHTRVRVP